MLWVEPDYNVDCPLHSRSASTARAGHVHVEDAAGRGRLREDGVETRSRQDAAKGPAGEWNKLGFRIGAVRKDPKSKEAT